MGQPSMVTSIGLERLTSNQLLASAHDARAFATVMAFQSESFDITLKASWGWRGRSDSNLRSTQGDSSIGLWPALCLTFSKRIATIDF